MKKDNRKLLPRKYCEGKISYDKKGAVTMMNHLIRKGREHLRIYSCPKCNMWHLTHKEKK